MNQQHEQDTFGSILRRLLLAVLAAALIFTAAAAVFTQ